MKIIWLQNVLTDKNLILVSMIMKKKSLLPSLLKRIVQVAVLKNNAELNFKRKLILLDLINPDI